MKIDKFKIIDMKLNGKSHNDISKELKCSKSTVSKHFGIIENVIKLRKDGKTYNEIKLNVDISYDLIKKICNKNKLISIGKYQKRYSKEEIEIFQEHYNNGNTLKEIQIKFGVHKTTLSKHLKTKTKKTVEEIKKCKSNNVISWRKRSKIKLVEYKGGCCQVCNYKKSIGALEFHHIVPSEKDFTVSSKSYSFDRLKKEVDKCVLVCSNCHIEIHEDIKNNGYSDIIDKLKKSK